MNSFYGFKRFNGFPMLGEQRILIHKKFLGASVF